MSKTQTVKRHGLRARLGPALGLIAVAALPAGIIPAAAQQESYDWRHLTVMQRPRDEFDPKGIPLGSAFRLLPSLEVNEAYTDNLYATDSNTIDDFQTTITPKLSLQSDWSRHSLSLSAFADIHRFIDNGTEDNEEYGAQAALGLELGQGGTFNLMGSYDRQTVSRGDPEESGNVEPEQVDVTRARADWRQVFSFLLLGFRADFANFSENSSLDRDKDRDEYGAAVRVGYVFSPSLSVFAEPFYSKRDFDLAVDFSGFDRDSEVMGINGGVAYDITGILYGETKIGYYRAGFKDPRISSDNGLSVESKTTYNMTPRNTFILTVSRRNVVTNEVNASSRVLTGGEFEYQHELRRNILLRANVAYYVDDFVESIPKREDTRISASARGDYLLNRYVSLYLQYTRNDVDSTIPIESFQENLFMIGIRTQI